MSPREIVGTIADRIGELDFGYESENTDEDTWRAALDIAMRLGVITVEQSQCIVDEDRNQRVLEQFIARLRRKRRWDAMTPEQQAHEREFHESFEAQSKVLRDIVYNSVFSQAYSYPFGSNDA